ncbi:MAG: DUF541 domain-containing protein [Spirochaetes bacterium]|jgi:uncharacterized protein YggE|nr:DUF541 domain-containing protein [Spirochaetota bacterium]
MTRSSRYASGVFAKPALVAALVFIVAHAAVAGGAAESAAGAGGSPARGAAEAATTLTVTGLGTVVGVPDTAVFSLGAQVVGESPETVLSESRARGERVLAALRDLGIPEERIQTTHYNMHTERYPRGPNESPDTIRYVATTGLRVDLADLERLDEVIAAATDAGATEIWGVNFGVSDSEARHDQARIAALEDARRKAEDIARAGGMSIVGVESVTTGAQPSPRLFESVQPMGRGGGGISPGELEFREAVTVVYRMR